MEKSKMSKITDISATRQLLSTIFQPFTLSYIFALQLALRGFCITNGRDLSLFIVSLIRSLTTLLIYLLLKDSRNSAMTTILKPFCMSRGCPCTTSMMGSVTHLRMDREFIRVKKTHQRGWYSMKERVIKLYQLSLEQRWLGRKGNKAATV